MSTTETNTTMTADRIEKRVTLRAPQGRVWRAIADAEEFGRWFGFRLEGTFTPGKVMKGTFERKLDENAIMEAQKSSGITPSKLRVPEGNLTLFTVDRMEPERYFSFRWIPFGIDAEADPEHEPTTLVEFRLEPVAEGTALTIVESGFERVPAHRRARAFRMNSGGWAAQAENLRKYVDGA
ncbi:MAG TPA: SRPBCC family protein [Polyangiaceae bacterium]|nr:SRPBCC family protein [Polyangiaceae bacterium]